MSRRTKKQMSASDEQDTSPPAKKQKQENIATSRLVVRARGFEGIYDESLPLDILSRFIDRHGYSTSTGGLHFYTEMIRRKAMRGAWKLSSSETTPSFLERFRGMNLQD